ncbi:hypothetical protein [Novosphingobium sp.]|uniref:hypothetical protein n=1 Tax=Novosphingobium sp. TaxID=1874826 RepID=UPI003B523B7F
MTGTSAHIAAAQAAARKIGELTGQLNAKVKRRATIANEQATALRTMEKLKAQIQADGVTAILADIPYDPPADLARQLRKATDKSAPCGAALAQLDSEIAALRSDIGSATRARAMSTFAFSSDAQRGCADTFKGSLAALIPQLAALVAIDTFRARHAAGALAGVPASGARPWQSTAVVANFLKALPAQLRPDAITLEAIQRLALNHVETLEAELTKENAQ